VLKCLRDQKLLLPFIKLYSKELFLYSTIFEILVSLLVVLLIRFLYSMFLMKFIIAFELLSNVIVPTFLFEIPFESNFHLVI